MILLSENVSQWDLYVANEILWIQCLATRFTGVPQISLIISAALVRTERKVTDMEPYKHQKPNQQKTHKTGSTLKKVLFLTNKKEMFFLRKNEKNDVK
jgi:hypothetical protein